MTAAPPSTEIYRSNAGPVETAKDHVCPKCLAVGTVPTHRSTCEDFRPVVRHGQVFCPRCGRNVPAICGAVGFHSHLMAPGTPCPGIGWRCAA